MCISLRHGGQRYRHAQQLQVTNNDGAETRVHHRRLIECWHRMELPAPARTFCEFRKTLTTQAIKKYGLAPNINHPTTYLRTYSRSCTRLQAINEATEHVRQWDPAAIRKCQQTIQNANDVTVSNSLQAVQSGEGNTSERSCVNPDPTFCGTVRSALIHCLGNILDKIFCAIEGKLLAEQLVIESMLINDI